MIKHIGRHGEKKIVVIFRQLQGMNEHMALVIYTETMPTGMHDEFMTIVRSPTGQSTNELSEVLGNSTFTDGGNILNTFHTKGWLKKVQTKQVILTANANTQVRLDEVNEIINKLEVGGEGARELASLDANRGLYDPKNADKIVDVKQFEKNATDLTSDTVEVVQEKALDNTSIAQMNISQADAMEAQIKTLTEEAARLKTEAYDMAPALKPKRAYKQRATNADKAADPVVSEA